MTKLWTTLRAHQTLILITFELFWIAVFLLNRIGGGSDGGVPQFVYVNF